MSLSSSSSPPSASASQPQLAPSELLLQFAAEPAHRPLTWQQLWTREGLPESDRRIVAECGAMIARRAALGAALAGGLVGGIGQ